MADSEQSEEKSVVFSIVGSRCVIVGVCAKETIDSQSVSF